MSSPKPKQFGNKRDYIAKHLREESDGLYRLRMIPHKNKKPPKKLRPHDVAGLSEEELEEINGRD